MPVRIENEKPSPIVVVFDQLRALHPNWYLEFGRRREPGWIAGSALADPNDDPFAALLATIGARLKTGDRKIIAASFALRFGWSSGTAIAPFLLYQCVPDVGLNNVSLKFSDGTLFERLSMHEPRGVIVRRAGLEDHPSVEILDALVPSAEAPRVIRSFFRASGLPWSIKPNQ